MVKSGEVADRVVEALAVKLRAMEETGRGFNAVGDVTMYDRLAVVLGSFNKKYADRVLSTEPEEADVKRVLEILEKHGVELSPEEIILLSKVRRFIDEKVKSEESTILDKIIDAGEEVEMNSDSISVGRWFPTMMLSRFE